METIEKKVFHIKCYTKKELAEQLGFKSVKSFSTALKGIEEEKVKKNGWYYTPLQVEAIVKHVGFDRIRNN